MKDGVAAKRNWGSVAAGFVGACALGVSMYTASLQRQQVRAQVWPIVELDYETVTNEKTATFRYLLHNRGMGPAILRAVEMRVDGAPVRRWRDAVSKLIPDSDPKQEIYIGDIHYQVFAVGQTQTIFEPKLPEVARAFATQANRITLAVCYCSVLDDCWSMRTDEPAPVSVDRCPRPEVPFEN